MNAYSRYYISLFFFFACEISNTFQKYFLPESARKIGGDPRSRREDSEYNPPPPRKKNCWLYERRRADFEIIISRAEEADGGRTKYRTSLCDFIGFRHWAREAFTRGRARPKRKNSPEFRCDTSTCVGGTRSQQRLRSTFGNGDRPKREKKKNKIKNAQRTR